MIKIGITKEYKIPNDFRTPFTPMQANEINKRKDFSIVCQSSNIRCFTDKEYKTSKGSAIVFPSNFMFPHEVKEVTKGERWSIITWLM